MTYDNRKGTDKYGVNKKQNIVSQDGGPRSLKEA